MMVMVSSSPLALLWRIACWGLVLRSSSLCSFSSFFYYFSSSIYCLTFSSLSLNSARTSSLDGTSPCIQGCCMTYSIVGLWAGSRCTIAWTRSLNSSEKKSAPLFLQWVRQKMSNRLAAMHL